MISNPPPPPYQMPTDLPFQPPPTLSFIQLLARHPLSAPHFHFPKYFKTHILRRTNSYKYNVNLMTMRVNYCDKTYYLFDLLLPASYPTHLQEETFTIKLTFIKPSRALNLLAPFPLAILLSNRKAPPRDL